MLNCNAGVFRESLRTRASASQARGLTSHHSGEELNAQTLTQLLRAAYKGNNSNSLETDAIRQSVKR